LLKEKVPWGHLKNEFFSLPVEANSNIPTDDLKEAKTKK